MWTANLCWKLAYPIITNTNVVVNNTPIFTNKGRYNFWSNNNHTLFSQKNKDKYDTYSRGLAFPYGLLQHFPPLLSTNPGHNPRTKSPLLTVWYRHTKHDYSPSDDTQHYKLITWLLTILRLTCIERLYLPLLAENQEKNEQENKQINTNIRTNINNVTTYWCVRLQTVLNARITRT